MKRSPPKNFGQIGLRNCFISSDLQYVDIMKWKDADNLTDTAFRNAISYTDMKHRAVHPTVHQQE
jgi:hypothetical protein